MIADIHITSGKTSETIGLPADNEAGNKILGQIIHNILRKSVLNLNDSLEETHLI